MKYAVKTIGWAVEIHIIHYTHYTNSHCPMQTNILICSYKLCLDVLFKQINIKQLTRIAIVFSTVDILLSEDRFVIKNKYWRFYGGKYLVLGRRRFYIKEYSYRFLDSISLGEAYILRSLMRPGVYILRFIYAPYKRNHYLHVCGNITWSIIRNV